MAAMSSRLTHLPDAPESVARFQHAYAAVSRVAILRELLANGPAQRVDLAAALGITTPSVRKALNELIHAGYVTYRLRASTTATSQEQPHGTLYSAQRERIMADLAATLAWLNEGPQA